ncbi:MAG: glutamine--tRNA ligase/YqeY domain fusion protein [Saprospiraceae bacterium]|nr:glutamine--tRNA ligase/YqeY domain fusion protein [Saprospiraceae bacterium]
MKSRKVEEKRKSLNFIEQIIEEDLSSGKHKSILTRFPPEPNGYLHIGHVKALWINFGLAAKYGGKTNLRFDDTNPATEETEYVEGIKRDIKWLGYDWEDREFHASDYFDDLYQFALKLIKDGNAYVDDSTSEEIAVMKGTPTQPGVDSPYRNRSVEENLELFQGMVDGKYPDGSRTLRAKIDIAHDNMLMRDPLLYRIKREHHHRTGDKWCVYPMYDFAHGQSDSIENITHSLCSLEFKNHRPLYDWLIEKLEIFPSRQIEFARMNVAFMITSKRRLLKLVKEGYVSGWDDPRMPTIAGMRRRGYPPEALILFCEKTGVAKRNILIEIELLESCIREVLNKTTNRVMVVEKPILLTITNYPEDNVEMLTAENNPEDENSGSREIPFSRQLYIEREDFMTNAPRKYYRLSEGRNVRLKHGYIVNCIEALRDEDGEVTEVLCTYYPDSKSGEDTSGVKAKGTLHWVSASHAISCEIRHYDRLFTVDNPLADDEVDYIEYYNKDSLVTVDSAMMEPSLQEANPGDRFQFLRKGYFCVDEESTEDRVVFNRTITLRDTWAKIKHKS